MMDHLLDFCRVKKIDEKGFGFLKSLYFKRDVFFHFSQIKKEEFLDKLNKMKRGEFFLYFISKELPDGKRRTIKIWYELKDVPKEFINDFKQKIIEEFHSGITNLFDLFHAVSELRNISAITNEDIIKIYKSQRIHKLPTTILPYLSESELKDYENFLDIDKIKKDEKKPFWFGEYESFMKSKQI